MYIVLLLLFTSVIIGYLLKHVPAVKYFSGKVNVTVVVMLLAFGIKVGTDAQVMDRIAAIGISAILLSFAGICGSIILAVALHHYTKKN